MQDLFIMSWGEWIVAICAIVAIALWIDAKGWE